MEACKEAGWKARGSKIKCKPQNKWFDQECETQKENLQSIGENISHNINNSEQRQLQQDNKKRFKQTCRQKKWESISEDMSLGIGISHITRNTCFPGAGTHITREASFPGKGTHITRHASFQGKGTHISRDMCFPGRETHITRDMCFTGGGKHITKDMGFPGRGTIYITRNMCFSERGT